MGSSNQADGSIAFFHTSNKLAYSIWGVSPAIKPRLTSTPDDCKPLCLFSFVQRDGRPELGRSPTCTGTRERRNHSGLRHQRQELIMRLMPVQLTSSQSPVRRTSRRETIQ